MADDHHWTADELKQLAPEERSKIVRERLVWDPSTIDPEQLAGIRARGREILDEQGLLPPTR